MSDPIWFVLLLPLLGAFVCGTHSGMLGRAGTATVATSAIGGAFLAALYRFAGYTQVTDSVAWTWLSVPLPTGQPFTIPFGAYVDSLCLTMLCTVTGVAFLIHWFSAGYMADEPDYGRYFTYLNLFVATMICLVLADNFAMLLIGWGGVGFASYALIGFYQQKPSAVKAARKAFLINVVGDIGLMVAILILALKTGSVTYTHCLAEKSLQFALGEWILPVGLGLLVAAYAKSAQFPLHPWLPDAMEGPTPVSALIHAATMVTAGVYLVVRCRPLFEAAGLGPAIALMGAVTALVAATCALVQTDLKRILAYSTMSQLGYMFLAAGAGAYTAAIFHLVTHAFFKALLFLTAGVIIHALHGEQDVHKMGGLAKKLPLACLAFFSGCWALAGLPIAAGFFSKEAVLGGAWEGHEQALVWVGLVVAALTAYYSFRAFFLVFYGHKHEGHELHLPGFAMNFPLLFLTILTWVAGLFGPNLAAFMAEPPMIAGMVELPSTLPPEHHWMMFTAVGLGLAGLAAAFFLHKGGRDVTWPDWLRSFLAGGWGLDGLYRVAFAQPMHRFSEVMAAQVDPVPSQRIPGVLGQLAGASGTLLGMLQTGSLRHYALGVLAAVAAFLAFTWITQAIGVPPA